MSTLHIVPGTSDIANGMVVVARLLAKEQGNAEVVDLADVDCGRIAAFDEIWVHGMWLPKERKVCKWALSAGKRLVRMTHGSLSPIYLNQQSKWKKRFASLWERPLLAKCDAVTATCQAEADWIKSYQPKAKVVLTDLKRFFNLGQGSELTSRSTTSNSSPCLPNSVPSVLTDRRPLHFLYLGRRHPLKGTTFLQEALRQLVEEQVPFEFRSVSNASGEELEKIWQSSDILVLPTLSENFGLVVAEALERGKPVITTDGAPVWEDQPGVTYIKGYRNGDNETRVCLLKEAIEAVCNGG